MICNKCHTVIGYDKDGSDQDYKACDVEGGCGKVYCTECAEVEPMFRCYSCQGNICRKCIVSVRDPENDEHELGVACPCCGDEVWND